jgi:hypothetical protein
MTFHHKGIYSNTGRKVYCIACGVPAHSFVKYMIVYKQYITKKMSGRTYTFKETGGIMGNLSFFFLLSHV